MVVQQFDSLSEAREYIAKLSNEVKKVDGFRFTHIDKDLLSTEYFSFISGNRKYEIELLEYPDRFTVWINDYFIDKLVEACQNNDLVQFEVEIKEPHSDRAIILAFKSCIYHDNFEMVKKFIEYGMFTENTMKESPLRTATIHDSYNCFFYLLEHVSRYNDLLAQILHNNAKKILRRILENNHLKEMILAEPFISNDWVSRLVAKKSNEAIELYKEYHRSKDD